MPRRRDGAYYLFHDYDLRVPFQFGVIRNAKVLAHSTGVISWTFVIDLNLFLKFRSNVTTIGISAYSASAKI
jgi:hypothetical protein